MSKQAAKQQGSQKARNTAARLAAVQALYQMRGNDQKAASVVREYIDFRLDEKLDGEAMVSPDKELFSALVTGVDSRRDDLATMIEAAAERKVEPLLNCILLCGTYELLAHGEIDAPLIISDYLHVTDAFYDQSEKKLINAVLDRLAKNLRV
jgi:N utilization substance protein B